MKSLCYDARSEKHKKKLRDQYSHFNKNKEQITISFTFLYKWSTQNNLNRIVTGIPRICSLLCRERNFDMAGLFPNIKYYLHIFRRFVLKSCNFTMCLPHCEDDKLVPRVKLNYILRICEATVPRHVTANLPYGQAEPKCYMFFDAYC